jgi:hypothetical protein
MNEQEGRALVCCAFAYQNAHNKILDPDGLVLFGMLIKGVPGFAAEVTSGKITPVQALASIEHMIAQGTKANDPKGQNPTRETIAAPRETRGRMPNLVKEGRGLGREQWLAFEQLASALEKYAEALPEFPQEVATALCRGLAVFAAARENSEWAARMQKKDWVMGSLSAFLRQLYDVSDASNPLRRVIQALLAATIELS